MIGSFCYRFADEGHAAKMLATLTDDPPAGWDVVHQTGIYSDTGNVDPEGQPIMLQEPGWLVFVLTDDTLPVEGWESWVFDTDDWPHFAYGLVEDQIACAEHAPLTQAAKIADDVPARPTYTEEEREKLNEERQARREAYATVQAKRIERERLRSELEATIKAIDGEPEMRRQLADKISSYRDKLTDLRSTRDDISAQIDDEETGKEQKESLRDQREGVNSSIDSIQKLLDRDIARRDAIREALPDLRDQREKMRADIETVKAEIITERSAKEAAIAEIERLKNGD